MTTLTMDAERLRAQSLELQPIVAMFQTEGWRKLASEIAHKTEETRRKLVLVSGVTSLEEVYAQRERYALLMWLLDLPAEKEEALKLVREQLYELEAREGS
jgi:hypothetical protein